MSWGNIGAAGPASCGAPRPEEVDHGSVFEWLAVPALVLDSDEPPFSVLAANDAFLRGPGALAHDYQAALDDQARHYIEPRRLREVDVSALALRILGALASDSPGRVVAAEVVPGLRALADPQLLDVLLSHLLGNAWKFTRQRQPAHVRVGVEQAAGRRAFFVADDGVGFDLACSARLFTPFQRLHRAGEHEGNGIGLAIAQRIVARHGGRIWARAEPGAGATVFYSLGGEDD